MMVQPAFNHSNGTAHLPCYAENVFELLGDATLGRTGDYYLDFPAKKLYLVSTKPPVNVILPRSVGLMVVTNTTNLTIKGLALREATHLLDNDGFVQAQAGCIVKTPTGSAPDSGGSQSNGFDSWVCMVRSMKEC
jgi:hypothetical protein